MNGEYLLSLDPYNFNTKEEFIKFYHPELLEEKELQNDEDIIKENLYER